MSDPGTPQQQLIDEITQLRQRNAVLEAELAQRKQAEADQQQIHDGLPVLIATAGPDGYYKKVNTAFERILGWSEQESLSRPFMDFIHPDDRAVALKTFGALKSGELTTDFVDRNLCKNGSYRWINWTVIPLVDRDIVFGIGQDITEKKRAEDALRHQHQRTQQYLDVAGVILVVLDNHGNIRLLNRKGYAILDYASETLLGKNWFDTCVPRRIRDEVNATFGELIAGRAPSAEYHENPVVTQSNEERVVVWHNALLRDNAGAIVGTLSSGLDITERKQTEHALRVSEAKYRRLHESIRDAFVAFTMDGRIQEYNDAFREMLGYEPEELAALTFRDLIPTKWHALQKDVFEKQVLLRGYSDIYEKEYRKKDGTVFPVELRTKLLRDDEGRPCGMWAIIRDITERKRAEKALQQARHELERQVKERTAELAIFQWFAEASGQGFGMADLEGRITYVNPALCRLFGEEKPEDVTGKNVVSYYLEGYKNKREHDIIPAVLRDGLWQGEQVVLSTHGTSTPVFQSTFLIRDDAGQPFRSAVVIADISERKKAEEALRASEEKYRTLVETSPDGVVMADLNGHITFASRQILEMHGSDRIEELLGRHPLDFIAQEDHQRFLANFRKTIEQGITRNVEYGFLKKNGTRMDGEVSAAVIRDSSGKLNAVVAIVRDITARKKAQEALEREKQSLWHMLQASDHERQIISYEIHDGLAQYLGAAGMQLQCYDALREKSPVESVKAYETGVELVRQAHNEARRLISAVRPPIIDEIGLETAISHLIHEQRRRGGPDIELHCSVQFKRLASILENALYRIVQEALSNACEHSHSKEVAVSLIQEGQEVCLKVQDWGIGFVPESVGTGHFGLEGIRQRVRLLGGRLSVESTPGSGTVVQVVVPILERQVEPETTVES